LIILLAYFVYFFTRFVAPFWDLPSPNSVD
jgi:hypothetical protein